MKNQKLGKSLGGEKEKCLSGPPEVGVTYCMDQNGGNGPKEVEKIDFNVKWPQGPALDTHTDIQFLFHFSGAATHKTLHQWELSDS